VVDCCGTKAGNNFLLLFPDCGGLAEEHTEGSASIDAPHSLRLSNGKPYRKMDPCLNEEPALMAVCCGTWQAMRLHGLRSKGPNRQLHKARTLNVE